MTAYFIRRILIGAFTLLAITMIMYALIRHIPGTPLTMAQENLDPRLKISDADIQLLNQAYGLDKVWYVAYFDWLKNLTRFDLGNSFRYRKPVTGLILDHL